MLTELTSPGACCANSWHTTRTIVIDEADQKICVGIGAPCDLCRPSAPTKAGGIDPLPPSEDRQLVFQGLEVPLVAMGTVKDHCATISWGNVGQIGDVVQEGRVEQ